MPTEKHDTTTVNADEFLLKSPVRSLQLMVAQERRRAGEELQRAVAAVLDPRHDGFVDVTEVVFHLRAALATLGFDAGAGLGRGKLDPTEPVTLDARLAHPYTP